VSPHYLEKINCLTTQLFIRISQNNVHIRLVRMINLDVFMFNKFIFSLLSFDWVLLTSLNIIGIFLTLREKNTGAYAIKEWQKVRDVNKATEHEAKPKALNTSTRPDKAKATSLKPRPRPVYGMLFVIKYFSGN